MSSVVVSRQLNVMYQVSSIVVCDSWTSRTWKCGVVATISLMTLAHSAVPCWQVCVFCEADATWDLVTESMLLTDCMVFTVACLPIMLVGVFCSFDMIMTCVWLCACRSWSRVTISSRTGSVTRTQSSALSSRWCRKYRGSVMNMASRVDMSTRTHHSPTRSDDPGGYCWSCWKVNLVSCWHKKMCGLMCLLMLLSQSHCMDRIADHL